MKAVIQRVQRAECRVGGELTGKCGGGLCIMLGVLEEDTKAEAEMLAAKIAKMRIFCDENDKMNLSVNDVGGGILVISNFTLAANCRRGNRPDYIGAKKPDEANELYEYFVSCLRTEVPNVETGMFGGDMKIETLLDGPITIVLDSDDLKRGRRS